MSEEQDKMVVEEQAPSATTEIKEKSSRSSRRSSSRDKDRKRSRRRSRSKSRDRRSSRHSSSSRRRRSRSDSRGRRRRSRSVDRRAPRRSREDRSCYNCGQTGHLSRDCPTGRNGSRSSRNRNRSNSVDIRDERKREESPVDPEEKARLRKLREEEENTRAIRTIFVSQLQVRVAERDIRSYFAQAGEVRDVRLIKDKYTQKSKGFCYIEMGKVEDVATALLLHGQKLCLKHDACNCSGFPISVKVSEAEKNIIAKQEKEQALALRTTGGMTTTSGVNGSTNVGGMNNFGVPSSNNNIPSNLPKDLEVKGLPAPLDKNDIRPLFLAFGVLVSIKILKRDEEGTDALVCFESYESCIIAHHTLHGFDVAGSILDCKITDATAPMTTHDDNFAALPPPPAAVGAAAGAPNIMVQSFPPQHQVMMPPAVDQTENNWTLDDAGDVGLKMDPNRRTALMHRLNKDSIPTPAVNMNPMAAVDGGIVGHPSNAFKLSNMFDPTQETEVGWDIDIREDVMKECSQWGEVIHCFIDKNSMGNVYILFGTIDSGIAAAEKLHGRWFDAKRIMVQYLTIPEYVSKNPDAQEVAARTL